MMVNELVVFDNEEAKSKWYITNDDVMGGLSTSSIQKDGAGLTVFSGEVSTDNNGGFAMARMPVNIDLKSNSKIVLTLNGDGKKYQLRIKSKKYQRYWYVQNFVAKKGLQTIELSLGEFYPSFRGYALDLDNFSHQKIREIAILIGNKKDERFELGIKRIVIK